MQTSNRVETVRGPREVFDSVAAALPAVMVFLAVLTIPLSAASSLKLSEAQLSSWVFALYAGPGILGAPHFPVGDNWLRRQFR
jgi:predicted benzoate:H+ symporter BenE